MAIQHIILLEEVGNTTTGKNWKHGVLRILFRIMKNCITTVSDNNIIEKPSSCTAMRTNSASAMLSFVSNIFYHYKIYVKLKIFVKKIFNKAIFVPVKLNKQAHKLSRTFL